MRGESNSLYPLYLVIASKRLERLMMILNDPFWLSLVWNVKITEFSRRRAHERAHMFSWLLPESPSKFQAFTTMTELSGCKSRNWGPSNKLTTWYKDRVTVAPCELRRHQAPKTATYRSLPPEIKGKQPVPRFSSLFDWHWSYTRSCVFYIGWPRHVRFSWNCLSLASWNWTCSWLRLVS